MQKSNRIYKVNLRLTMFEIIYFYVRLLLFNISFQIYSIQIIK